MVIVTLLAIKTVMAIVTALVIETDIAIATVLASKPTFMVIMTVPAIKIDIHGYRNHTGLETDIHGYRDHPGHRNRHLWLS